MINYDKIVLQAHEFYVTRRKTFPDDLLNGDGLYSVWSVECTMSWHDTTSWYSETKTERHAESVLEKEMLGAFPWILNWHLNWNLTRDSDWSAFIVEVGQEVQFMYFCLNSNSDPDRKLIIEKILEKKSYFISLIFPGMTVECWSWNKIEIHSILIFYWFGYFGLSP